MDGFLGVKNDYQSRKTTLLISSVKVLMQQNNVRTAHDDKR